MSFQTAVTVIAAALLAIGTAAALADPIQSALAPRRAKRLRRNVRPTIEAPPA